MQMDIFVDFALVV